MNCINPHAFLLQINIRFHDVLFETFEYPSEETMLEDYLKEHPNEVLVLEEVSWPAESSDDVDVPETPRGGGGRGGIEGIISEGELLKSNTSLAHSGLWMIVWRSETKSREI